MTTKTETSLPSIKVEVVRGTDILEVSDPLTNKVETISWQKLSNVSPGLKYRCECVDHLCRLVGAETSRNVDVSADAEALIDRATTAACLLY